MSIARDAAIIIESSALPCFPLNVIVLTASLVGISSLILTDCATVSLTRESEAQPDLKLKFLEMWLECQKLLENKRGCLSRLRSLRPGDRTSTRGASAHNVSRYGTVNTTASSTIR